LFGFTQEYVRGALDAYTSGTLTKKYPGIGRWRQMGKTCNFAMLFKATARTVQDSIRRDVRLNLPLELCQPIVNDMSEKYSVLRAYQDNRIAWVKKHPEDVLPITGISRVYAGGPRMINNMWIPTICNFPVQCLASQIMQSAQREISDAFHSQGMVSTICENCYDAVKIDSPEEEEPRVMQLFDRILPCPAFYREVQLEVGRTLPITFEVKVLARKVSP
jgi:hypothetical protein